MADEKKPATRPVGNARILRDGSIVAESTLSPESFVVGAEVWIPPRKVIPIVFLPGIMGSNLKVKEDKRSAATVRKRMGAQEKGPIPNPWRPPNGKIDGLSEASAWKKRNPQTRQALLSGDTTVVDDSGFIDASLGSLSLSDLTSNNNEEARFRGWGTVHWDSYGKFLLYLERSLQWLTKSGLKQVFSEWSLLLNAGNNKDVPATFKVSEDDLKKMSKHWFPVYACGYNWINSNAESGQRVLDVIEKIIQVYTGIIGPSGKQLFECEKVILVTHSMGGLVGRWAAKNDKKKRILGVIHGVQPATGAPLAYRRTAAGTEPGGFIQNKFAQIIGETQAETTPAMGNSAGALQLLPTKLYPKGWLQIERQNDESGEVETLLRLPNADPYQEIYREKQAWWRMVDPNLLDPAGRYASVGKDPWTEGFINSLKQAESFHGNLGDYYLENKTYAYYGDDSDHPSFGSVRWRVMINHRRYADLRNDEIINSRLHPDHSEAALSGHRPITVLRPTGQMSLDNRPLLQEAALLRADIQPQDVPGDGTVPWQSGEAPGKASAKGKTFAFRGYDHQGSYDHTSPQRFTLWAITRLITDAT